MLSFKKIAGFLKKVGSRDANHKDDQQGKGASKENNNNSNEAVGSGLNALLGEDSTSNNAVTPILHGLPPNAGTQAVLKHVFGVVSRKSQHAVDEAPWLLLVGRENGSVAPENEQSSNKHRDSKSRRQTFTSTPLKADLSAVEEQQREQQQQQQQQQQQREVKDFSQPSLSVKSYQQTPATSFVVADTPPGSGSRGGGASNSNNKNSNHNESNDTTTASAEITRQRRSVSSLHTNAGLAVGDQEEGEEATGSGRLAAAVATPTTPKVQLPSVREVATTIDVPSPMMSLRQSEHQSNSAMMTCMNYRRLSHPGATNLLASLQKERAEMIEALDVCLQEVPDCENELELVQHVLDAMTVDYQQQLQQEKRERERRSDSVMSGRGLGSTTSPPVSRTLPGTALSGMTLEIEGCSHRTPIRRSRRQNTNANRSSSKEAGQRDGEAHSACGDDTHGEGAGGNDEDDDELYPDDRSYVVDDVGEDGYEENEGSAIFSFTAGTRVSTVPPSESDPTVAATPTATATRTNPILAAPFLFRRGSSFAPGAASSQAIALRTTTTAAAMMSSAAHGTQVITLYEWRCLLLQIVELLIGVDRAMYIELSQNAIEHGAHRNALLREQLERESQAAAVAVANACTVTTAPNDDTAGPSKEKMPQQAPAAPAAAPSVVAKPLTESAASGVASTTAADADRDRKAAKEAVSLAMAASPDSFTSPREIEDEPQASSPPSTHTAADKKKATTEAHDGLSSSPMARPAARTPLQQLQQTDAIGASRQVSSGIFCPHTVATPNTGTSTMTTPNTQDLGTSPLLYPPNATSNSTTNHTEAPAAAAGTGQDLHLLDAALWEAAAAAAANSLTPVDVKKRKAAALTTTKAVDDTLGAACTLATWVALRSILRQHIAHLEEAATKFAEAEAAILTATAAAAAARPVSGKRDAGGSEEADHGRAEDRRGGTTEEMIAEDGATATLPSTTTTTATASGAAHASPRPHLQEEVVLPQMKSAAHRVLSVDNFPAISVAWADVVRELQELLALPNANLAASIMCASLLRDDGRELLLCMLQDPQPKHVLDTILANMRRLQRQSSPDLLGLDATGSTNATTAIAGTKALGGATAAGSGGDSSRTSSGGSSTTSSSSTSSAHTNKPSTPAPTPPSPAPKPTATATTAKNPPPLASSSTLPTSTVGVASTTTARVGSLPPLLSTATLTHSSTTGNRSTTVPAATASPRSPILSNRVGYSDDVVLDDVLCDLERAYHEGVSSTWSAYLETTIMVPFLKSIGVRPPATADEGKRTESSPGREDSNSNNDAAEEREDVVTNVDEETDMERRTSKVEGGENAGNGGSGDGDDGGGPHVAMTTTTVKKSKKGEEEQDKVVANLTAMLATDESDSVLCQVATAYFFCSDKWDRAMRHDGFSFLYHHARQRVAVAKEKEDWAMGKKCASLAYAMAQQSAATAAARRRGEAASTSGKSAAVAAAAESLACPSSPRASPADEGGLPLSSGFPLTPDSTSLGTSSQFLLVSHIRNGWQMNNSNNNNNNSSNATNTPNTNVNVAVAAGITVSNSEAGESNSNYGSQRWSPFIYGSGAAAVQAGTSTLPPLAAAGVPNAPVVSSEVSVNNTTSSGVTSPVDLLGIAGKQNGGGGWQQQQQQQLTLAQQLYQQLLQIPDTAPCAASFAMDQEMGERMLNMAWSAALHKRTEHCLSAHPPPLEEAVGYAQQERVVANVFSDFRARQRALSSLVNVMLSSGKSREAYQVSTKHFKNEKKEWTTHTQTMFTAIRYMQSMTQLVRAQAGCHAYGAVIETGQFVVPQADLCEEMLHVLSPRPRGAFVLRFGDARLKLLRARIYLKKEIWRAYAAYDDDVRAGKYFMECVQEVWLLRRRQREAELFDVLMERGSQLMQKQHFTRSVSAFKFAVELTRAALERVKTRRGIKTATATAEKAATGVAAVSSRVPVASPATAAAGADKQSAAAPLATVTNANTGVTTVLSSATSTTKMGAILRKDIHQCGAGLGNMTSAEEHGAAHSAEEEEDLELPWRLTESERMLALAFVMSAEHEVNVPERRRLLSNAVNNAYASQSSLQKWQAGGGTPKSMLTAVPLSLVMCKALLLLKQPKKAALLLEPLIEDKHNSAQVRPPMWKELLNPTTDPLTAEDIVLRTYVNSVRLSAFHLYAQSLSRFDGQRALRAVGQLGALIAESESWMRTVQLRVRAASRQLQQIKAAAATANSYANYSNTNVHLARGSISTLPYVDTVANSVDSTRGGAERNTPLSVSVGSASPAGPTTDMASGTLLSAAAIAKNGSSTTLANVNRDDGTESVGRSSSSVGSTAGVQTSVPHLVVRSSGGGGGGNALGHSPHTTSAPGTIDGLSPTTTTTVPRGNEGPESSFTTTTTASRGTTGPSAGAAAGQVVISIPSLSPYAADGATSAANNAGTGSNVEDGIRVSMESQSERVTAWRALWQMGCDLRKATLDMGITAGDAFCLQNRHEDALESYSKALVVCMTEEDSIVEQRQQHANRNHAPSATASHNRPMGGRSGSVSYALRQQQQQQERSVGTSPNLTPAPAVAAAAAAGLTSPMHSSSPVKLFDENDPTWLQEEEDELDSAIADTHTSESFAVMHDLRAVVSAEVRRDYKAAENRVLGKLAEVYKALDKPNMAIHYLKQVLEYGLESKDALLEYTSMLQLARLYTFTNADAEAQEMWERVSALAKQYEDTEVTRETLRNIISGQVAAGMFPTVVETAAELNTLASEGEGADAAADKRFALEALASAHLQLAHYQECLDALDAREKVQERSGEWNGRLFELRARARLGMGEGAEGVKVLLRWVNRARQMRNPVELAHANGVLAATYAAEGEIYKARRCHLAALRAMSMICTPLSKENREMVLESARWLVHYYYLNTDEVQVDPSLKDTRPANASRQNGRNSKSMFLNCSSSSFEHNLHNNSGDLAAILEEDERMRAEQAATADKEGGDAQEDDDDVENFLGSISGSPFVSKMVSQALLAYEVGMRKASGKFNEDGATCEEKEMVYEEEEIAIAEEGKAEEEEERAEHAGGGGKKAPEKPLMKTVTAPPTANSTRPPPPPTTLANVSICSRPAAAAAGTDVLECIPNLDSGGHDGGVSWQAGGGGGPHGSNPNSSSAARGGTAPPPLSLPDELNYQSPATVSTLCFNSAIETMEWATRLLFPTELLPNDTGATHAIHPSQHQPYNHYPPSTPNMTSPRNCHAGGDIAAATTTTTINYNVGTELAAAGGLPRQAQLQHTAGSCAIPYSPAEAVDFALLAFPRCTFVFYFAEYAMPSSSCYDIVIRPANRNHFIHRSTQVTTLKNFHDPNILQRVMSTTTPASKQGVSRLPSATESGGTSAPQNTNSSNHHNNNNSSSTPGTSLNLAAAKLPSSGVPNAPAGRSNGNPMLVDTTTTTGGAAAKHANDATPLSGEELTRALSDDNVIRLHDLHDELWMPVVAALKRARLTLEDAECLIIVADSTLMDVPFPALLPNPENGMPGDSEEPLGLQATTLLTPSLSHLVHRGLTRPSSSGRRRGRGAGGARRGSATLYAGFPPLSSPTHEEEEESSPRLSREKNSFRTGYGHHHHHHHRHHRAGTRNANSLYPPPPPRIVNVILLDDDDDGDHGDRSSGGKTGTKPPPPASSSSAALATAALASSSSNATAEKTTKQKISRSASQAGGFLDRSGKQNTTGPTAAAAADKDGDEGPGQHRREDPFDELLGRRQTQKASPTSHHVFPGQHKGGEGDDDDSESSDDSTSTTSSTPSKDEAGGYEPRTEDGDWGSGSYDCTGLNDDDHGDDGDDDADADGGGKDASETENTKLALRTIRPGEGDDAAAEDDGARWVIHRGCTRKEFIHGLANPNTRIFMVLSVPVDGIVRVADGVVGLHDLHSYYKSHCASVTHSSRTGSPRKGSASVSLNGSSTAVNPDGYYASGASHTQRAAALPARPSLAHLDLYVTAADRGKVPVATELVPAAVCLQLGCPRVLRVDLIRGTSLSHEHKEFILAYMRHVEQVQRWMMAYPYALALRMTMEYAVKERQWPATVWGAFTLVGTG